MQKRFSVYGKTMFLLCCALSLYSCALSSLLNTDRSQTADLPAASYFRWLTQASADEIEGEAVRLATPAQVESLVSQVQRAMLRYIDQQSLEGAPQIDPEGELIAACRSNARCNDYLSFESLLRELDTLRLQLNNGAAAARVLEDRIRNLDQQIEALTNIEQQLLERDQRPN